MKKWPVAASPALVARCRFCTCASSFFTMRCFFSSAARSNGSSSSGAPAFTSIAQFRLSSPTRLYPCRGAHSPVASSHTMRPRFFFSMPLDFANFSHRVSGRGLGTGLARGRRVVAAGSMATGPTAVLSTGSSKM